MVDHLRPLEDITHPHDLVVGELRPRRDVSAEDDLGEFDSFGVGESEFSGVDEDFLAEGGDSISHFVEAINRYGEGTGSHAAADGLSRAFISKGRCTSSTHDPDQVREDGLQVTRSRWWWANGSSGYVKAGGMTVAQRNMQKAALTLCQLCPVQWECVEYAIDSESHFVWASTERERKDLALVPDWKDRVAQARRDGISVQRMIATIRGDEP